jgi:hypothetical protein
VIVKPKDGVPRGGTWPDNVMIECEVVAPRSAVGRTVYVLTPQAQLPAILKAVRDTAIVARSKGEGAG